MVTFVLEPFRIMFLEDLVSRYEISNSQPFIFNTD